MKLSEMYERIRKGASYEEAQEQSASGVDRLYEIHRRIEWGMRYADALKEVDQIDRAHGTVARSIIRVRSIANNGGYPIELTPDTIEPAVDDGSYIYLASNLNGVRAYTFDTIDKGKPGSDITVYAVMSGDGRVLGRHRTKEGAAEHIRAITAGEISEEPLDDSEDGHVNVIDSIGIARDGDDFVVRAGDGRILGRGSSEEDVMRILQAMSEQLTSDEPLEDEELSEDASRFDIIEIE